MRIRKLAQRVAKLQNLFYRAFHGLLRDVRPGDLDHPAAIKKLSQDAFKVFLAVGYHLDVAHLHNRKMIERLESTRDDVTRPKAWLQERLERELDAARGRAVAIDATLATINGLKNWECGRPGDPVPGAGASACLPDDPFHPSQDPHGIPNPA